MSALLVLLLVAAGVLGKTREKVALYGKDAVLECDSNAGDHIFLFWQRDTTMIGPYGRYDERKYNYEVLSGNLTVRAATYSDQGVYSCFSQGIHSKTYKVSPVRLIVEKDWEEVDESDTTVNTFRIVLVMGCLGLLGAVSYVVWKIWKDRYRHPSYLEASEEDDEDDDSAEEIFSAPGVPGPSRAPQSIIIERASESENISTDFGSILESANAK